MVKMVKKTDTFGGWRIYLFVFLWFNVFTSYSRRCISLAHYPWPNGRILISAKYNELGKPDLFAPVLGQIPA